MSTFAEVGLEYTQNLVMMTYARLLGVGVSTALRMNNRVFVWQHASARIDYFINIQMEEIQGKIFKKEG